ncbi:EAL domain-containing protein [Actinoplanes sp. TBRC 11911]|uniref:putative bifunctional diguanylate cyclase/phosphodiesterase n=1 Tax=Actinoplanes sp. TBRC 11911 TaxID=2729386 RepID=UPI00145F3FEA|nr:EAL domain-containing protein [Actinoplanes sp. TBRC 11911]NMO53716.1 EAL domain-containing protein [Actinoplanes sp. TBRC 11911]
MARRGATIVPPVDAARGDASRWRMGLLWLLALTAIVVAGVSTVAITKLQKDAERSSELRLLLTEMQSAAWQQSTIRLEAVMANRLSPSAAQTRQEIHDYIDAIGDHFSLRDPGNPQAQAVQDTFETYDHAVDEEFILLGRGDIGGAQRLDAERAAPAYKQMTLALADADRHYKQQVDNASARAQLGAGLIVGSGALIMLLLVWQSHRLRSRSFRRATYQASHDALTGLPNRVLLHQRITRSVDADTGAALLLIDLDRFKEVNDTLGHHYGDHLLIEVAQRMQAILGPEPTVARLGGDEFAVLLPGVSNAQDVAALAGDLQKALAEPFLLDGLSLTVAGSIGAALCPQHGSTADELMQRADIAMYAAKTRRAGYLLFDDSQDSTDPRKLTLASDLRRAIDQNQLTLHYQPKVDAHTATVLGAEALIRWHHPEHGMVPPDEFIPLAEHTGLITPLTRFVLDTAVRQCRSWMLDGHQLSVAVNISTHQLLDLGFPTTISDLLTHWQVPARLLTLEITETAIMADPDRALQTVQQLHDLGVQLSIDDFGTGYSSMAYLKTLPVDELKIDRSFVSRMTTSERDAIIVRSTVELGRNLGLNVVAEGVEDSATRDQLDAVGCNAIQGYYISKPVASTGFGDWLTEHANLAAASPTRKV